MSTNESIGIIIQARTGSTRLPQKTILPFYNDKGILELLLDKLLAAELGIPIIVATTDKEEDLKISEIVSNKNKIGIYHGSEHNVLRRFIDTADHYNLNKIIRICADNPFLDLESLKYLIENFNKYNCDYLSFKIDNIPSIKTHYGFWAEAVSLKALKNTFLQTNNTLYLEHVTNYIYENNTSFNVKFIEVIPTLSNGIRLTLDDIEDFKLQQQIFSDLAKIHGESSFSIQNILEYVQTHKDLIEVMKQQIKKYSK